MSCSFYFLKNQYFGSMKPVLHKNDYLRPTMYCFAESTLFFVLKCFEKVRNLFIDIPLYSTPYTLGKGKGHTVPFSRSYTCCSIN